mgnify:FL=1|tara:strand:- start:396 stop:1319 length:924 start_codon:yes stop_codon:yes gene_type:complete
MSLLSQKTITKKISISGFGIHTGSKVDLNVLPSAPNSGIIFKRVDIKNNNIIIPNFSNVSDATLCTTISNQHGVKVSTIEHLMAAFYGLGIDNAIVEVNSQEVPILDGSAKDFVNLIQNVGYKVSDVPIKLIKINKKIEIEEGKKFISIDKSNVSLEIDFEIKYKNNFINIQRNKVNIYEDKLDDIYNSRTFCLYEDIEKLNKLGLGKGGSLDNAIVVKENKILNKDGLRNKMEFVNHKILDCMGDLYLSGYRIIGSLVCSQGGHNLTNKLLKKIFSDNENYSLLEIKGKNLPYSFANKGEYLKSIA